MKLKNQNILIVSNEKWGNTWYSKHNYAWELSKNNTVFFINPPIKFNLFNIFKKNITEKKISENLITLTYRNILPVKIEFLRIINEKIIFRYIKKYLSKKKINEVIFWTFDPIRLSEMQILKPTKIILHAVDDYLFTYPSEKIIAQKADIVLCVSDEIASNFKKYNDNVHVIYHAIPSDEFEIKSNFDLINSQKKKAIYVGNVDLRIDFDYQNYIIQNLPEIDFYFIGNINLKVQTEVVHLKEKYSNVYFLGEIPYKKIKYYINECDFCFVFKDINHPGNNISSHKMLQYFAQGKPIFCTMFSRYMQINDLIYMTNDKEKMLELIKNYIKTGEDKDKVTKRLLYAKAFTFEKTLEKIETLL